jgi:hypothetical protein
VFGVFFATCGPAPTTVDPCKGRQAGDLVITEAMIDPDSTDTGAEWFEVYNALGTPLDLKGMTIYVKDLDGTNLKTHVVKAGSVPSQGYFTFGDVRGGPNPAWINYSYADTLGSMGNTRGAIGVRCGTTVIDEVTYARAAKSGRSRMLAGGLLTPNASTNDNEANWCDTPAGTVYLTPNAGTPGLSNPDCIPEAQLGTCLDNGAPRPIVPPGPGDLLITEVMASPAKANDTTGEWFEVLARADVDLNDVTVANGSGSSDTLASQSCLHVSTGQYVLLARSSDSFVNGDLPPPTATYSLSFSSTNERVILRRGDAGIDEAAVFASASGKAWQLDPNRLDGVSNDDPNNFCKAPNKWNVDGGGDFGSPAAENPMCPATDAGMMTDPNNCIDPVTLAVRPVRRPNVGDLVITEWMADPAAVGDTAGEYFEALVKVDTDLNGLVLGDSSTTTSTVQGQGCIAVTANSFVVFAKNANPIVNGNLPPVAATFAFDLNNSADSIRVLGVDGGLLDSVSYTTFRAGASTQLKPGLVDPADNDVAGNLCFTPDAGSNHYGALLADGGVSGDFGTPGLVNVACP